MRDPRNDPRPGDVLLLSSSYRCFVVESDSTYNGFVVHHDGRRKSRCRCRISTWKRKTRDAEVLHVAEDE